MRTTSLELASVIIAETGQHPIISLGGNAKPLHFFDFPDSDEILAAAARYASDELILPARHLLQVRSMLYREMRGTRA